MTPAVLKSPKELALLLLVNSIFFRPQGQQWSQSFPAASGRQNIDCLILSFSVLRSVCNTRADQYVLYGMFCNTCNTYHTCQYLPIELSTHNYIPNTYRQIPTNRYNTYNFLPIHTNTDQNIPYILIQYNRSKQSNTYKYIPLHTNTYNTYHFFHTCSTIHTIFSTHSNQYISMLAHMTFEYIPIYTNTCNTQQK